MTKCGRCGRGIHFDGACWHHDGWWPDFHRAVVSRPGEPCGRCGHRAHPGKDDCFMCDGRMIVASGPCA